ncbi:hypothetical protein ABCG99_14760, partial [Klebsiella pneumoniae]
MVSFTALRVKIRQPVYFCQTNALQGRIIWYDAPRLPEKEAGQYQALPRGGVPERPKGADCKSAVIDFEGSN